MACGCAKKGCTDCEKTPVCSSCPPPPCGKSACKPNAPCGSCAAPKLNGFGKTTRTTCGRSMCGANPTK